MALKPKGVTIAEKMRPFTHRFGSCLLIPQTDILATCYPTQIELFDFFNQKLGHWTLPIEGPVSEFTALVDLEKKEIHLWGFALKGYFRFILKREKEGIVLRGDRGFIKGFICELPYAMPRLEASQTRLSLGSTKAQDWDMALRRGDLKEVLPLWYTLGAEVNAEPIALQASLLDDCRKAIANKEKLNVSEVFTALFKASFRGIGATSSTDLFFQGYSLPPIIGDPRAVLTEGRKLIESLFLQVDGAAIQILPVCPPEFSCGRLINVKVANLGALDLEWTKKAPRRVIFSSIADGEIRMDFPKSVVSCRLVSGCKKSVFTNGELFTFMAGEHYLFDNFLS